MIIDRRQSQLGPAVAEIGGDAAPIRGDISNLADLDRIYDTVNALAGHHRAGRARVLQSGNRCYYVLDALLCDLPLRSQSR